MSTTVAELIEEIQEAIPEDKLPNLFPCLNRAIKTISKRLFVLESDLILGSLDVRLFASVDYTASSIACVSGGRETSDYLTDSASQFVIEGFAKDMPITTDVSGNEGPHRIYSVAADIINLDARESTLTSATAGSSVTMTSCSDFGYMPDDFLGFVDKPYVEGLLYSLEPVQNQATRMVMEITSGVPLYYKIKGNRLYVMPKTSSNITIKGDYWQNPLKLTTMDDYVPWNELFDDVIQEYLARVLVEGVAASSNDLAVFLTTSLDIIVPKRQKKAATHFPAGPWG